MGCLTGISFATEGPKMEVVATDSYRLAKIHGVRKRISALKAIPSRSLDELHRIMDAPDENVEIHFSPKYCSSIRTFFQSRLIDGKYRTSLTIDVPS